MRPQDDVNLAHSGALLMDETREFCRWHNHDGEDLDAAATWSLGRSKALGFVDRLLCNVYVDGSTDENGPLVVWPRKLADPWAPPTLQQDGDWEGQTVVRMPPGSAVVFDQALFHSARPPTARSVRRYIFGGHYTGWHNRRRHREDNAYAPSDELRRFEEARPLLFRPRPVEEERDGESSRERPRL